MARQCKVCDSRWKTDIEYLARHKVPLFKIVTWLKEKAQVEISQNSIAQHLKRHTSISTKGLFTHKENATKAVIKEQPSSTLCETTLLTEAKNHRRASLTMRWQRDGATPAEIAAAFVEEEKEAKDLKDTQEACRKSMEKGDAKRREIFAYRDWKAKHESLIRRLYLIYKNQKGDKNNV